MHPPPPIAPLHALELPDCSKYEQFWSWRPCSNLDTELASIDSDGTGSQNYPTARAAKGGKILILDEYQRIVRYRTGQQAHNHEGQLNRRDQSLNPA